ncbi:alpha/beta hydrolase [Paenibacillus sp. PAMC21692]|nr:alpha/beta hydrolase [Paenibacillus sp. PAMC21692]
MLYRLWEGDAPLAKGTSDEDVPRLELFLVPEQEREGLVIVCPGGGYGGRAAHEAYPITDWLNSIGISAAVLHYRVKPYQYPVPMVDAQRAVRFARQHAAEWGVNPDRIALLGFSAGGHLASTVGTHFDGGDVESEDPVERHSCKPDALILCYPVISFMEPFTHGGSVEAQLGANPDEELLRSLSNDMQVSAETPPTFLWHTAEDRPVPVENSIMFAMALSRHQVPFELHIFEKGEHGVGLAHHLPDTARWTELCGNWLKRLGYKNSITQPME